MAIASFVRWASSCAVIAGLLVAPMVAAAAEREKITKASVKIPKDSKTVDLFKGMKEGTLEVRFIPHGPEGANVLIKNKTDKPLRIALPGAFAGVPVHRQFGGAGMGGMGGGMGGMGGGMGGMGGGGMGGGQGMGGGMGGGGMGGGGMGGGGMGGMGGGGGGFFNVAPDKVGKIPVTTVCLEHGRPDPTPRMKYTIIPIEKFTTDPEVIELCKLVGAKKVPQNVAQATAWHLTDKMSWVELARKDRVKLRNGYTEKFFAPKELAFAIRLSQVVHERAKAYKQQSPGKHNSLSNDNNQQVGEE